MKATFVELPPFERLRPAYLNGKALAALLDAELARRQPRKGNTP